MLDSKKSECWKKIRLGPGADRSNLGMLEWQILFVQQGHSAEM